MPNRRSKRPQGHRDQKVVQLRPADPLAQLPDPPVDVDSVAKAAWDSYWGADIARAAERPDEYALRRWIEAVNEREKLHKVVLENPMVDGSQGQPVLNPLARRLEYLEGQIERFERQFGMTPKARADLGIATGQAALTAEQLNRMATEDEPDQNGSEKDGAETIDGVAEEFEEA